MRKALEFPRIDEGKLDAVEGEEVPLQPTTTHKIKRYKI